MKKDKGRLLDDEALGNLMDRQVRQAVGVDTSKLSKERERVTKYYNGELPRPQHAGQSSYVSTDVYDAVEAMKADLVETFSGGQDIVKFAPNGPNDVEPCRIQTEFASYVFYRQNPGYHIIHDAVDDGLKARVGVVKVYWEENVATEDQDFDGLMEHEVHGLAAQDQVKEMKAEQQPDGTFSGSYTQETSYDSQVCVENVPPENFFTTPWAKKLTGNFHAQKELMTKDQMKTAGLDVDKLKDIQPDNNDYVVQELETQARFQEIDSGYRDSDQEAQPEMRRWVVYECIDEFILNKGERPKLYKVHICSKQVLKVEEIKRSPFKVFCPLRTAHNFWGNSFAKRVIPTQNARTVLTRGILDHTVITNNPRYTVLRGGLTNPREMLDNRIGGIVNISQPDSVKALEQPSLNPFVFQTLGTLKENAEQTTGISSLSQGLNKDAISSQNSQGMVEGLVDLSKMRQKVIARNLAEFLAEVFIEISNLVIENQDRKCVVEVAGNWQEIDPRTWSERKNYVIELFLGQGAQDAEAMKLTGLAIQAKQDPFLARSMGDQGTYNLAYDIARMRGIKTFNRYFQPPDKTPPAQPSPEQQELQLKQQEMQLKGKEMQAKVQIAQSNAQSENIRTMHEQQMAQIDQQNAVTDQQLKVQDSHRKDMDIANKIDVSQRELQIVEKAPPADLKAIAAPRG